MTKQNSLAKRVAAIVASPRFFWGIIALFVLQAAWIASSGRYPMAFDEDFHLGIIRLYSHHLAPFWSSQPVGANNYGAVFRDPSYLYQYLMSFPYRFIRIFTTDQSAIVMWLRAINIALFATGLAIYRRLLMKTGASRAIIHSCLLVFVLMPVVPLLAAQINYDNLFLPLTASVLLITVNFSNELSEHRRINLVKLTGIVILCLLGSLVKYAFLPIALAVMVYLAVRMWQVLKGPRQIWKAKMAAFKSLGLASGLVLAAGLIISAGLFIERYGVNTVRYHTPLPDCSKVLDIEDCSEYGPWIRDHNLALQKSPDATKSPVVFAADWFYGMWLRSFFAVDGPDTQFQTRGPLIIPAISAIVFAGLGLVLGVAYAKTIFRKYDISVLALLLSVSGVYLTVLWLDNYRSFLHTGVAVAINGRYLLPALLPLILMGMLGINEFCKRKENLKLFLGGVAVVTMLWGGGALTYILRSSPSWYWPGSPLTGTNQDIRNALGPLTPGYKDPIAFMHHRR